MKYKGLFLLLMLCIAIGAGSFLGHRAGLSFAEMWDGQSRPVTASRKYESIIDENILKLKASDAIPAYEAFEGYDVDGTLVEQQQEWNLVLVNKWNPMEAGYEPELTEISEGHRVDSRIVDSLRSMIADAKKSGYYIYILSSYRDMEKQIDLYNAEVEKWKAEGYSKEAAEEKAGTIVAFPGTSEHHLGLAVDLVSSEHIKLDRDAEKTKGYQWLVAHCQEYGFILRYPNNASEITGIIYEPWHFRYVGEVAAKAIMEQGITLEEYLSGLSNRFE